MGKGQAASLTALQPQRDPRLHPLGTGLLGFEANSGETLGAVGHLGGGLTTAAQTPSYSRRNLREAELMQYLSPVGSGPSSNTCPKWEPQLAHSTSVRRMNRLRSSFSRTYR